MDLPPSGWYPDPYGTPGLLRWWDGSGWTQHTHPDPAAGNGAAGADGGGPAAVQATTVQPATTATTAPQATMVQSAAVQSTAVQATAVQPTTVQPGVTQVSADRLRRTKPPTGQPTAPQPALPASPGIAPTAFQPGVFQPTAVQPGYPQPAPFPSMAGTAGAAGGAEGTQVLYGGGDTWQVPGGFGGPVGPGGPGAPGPGNPYGYLEAQRRRRRRLITGLAAGTVVAAAAIALIAANVGGSPSTTAADQQPAVPTAAPATAPPSPTASTSPSPTPSATPPAGSLVTDGQSGLSYAQLPTASWQGASCAPSLDPGVFTWTDGEYATAGQVNGGSMTWYGEACSGLLPQSYGYSGTAQLESTAENLAQTFSNAYYSALNPSGVTPQEDQATQVSGHPAWEVTYDVAYANGAAQGVTWGDEEAAVVVVDNGSQAPAVFFASVPQNLNEANVTTLVSSLQLNAPGSGGAADTSSGGAADTSQDGNGGSGNGYGNGNRYGQGNGGGYGNNP